MSKAPRKRSATAPIRWMPPALMDAVIEPLATWGEEPYMYTDEQEKVWCDTRFFLAVYPLVCRSWRAYGQQATATRAAIVAANSMLSPFRSTWNWPLQHVPTAMYDALQHPDFSTDCEGLKTFMVQLVDDTIEWHIKHSVSPTLPSMVSKMLNKLMDRAVAADRARYVWNGREEGMTVREEAKRIVQYDKRLSTRRKAVLISKMLEGMRAPHVDQRLPPHMHFCIIAIRSLHWCGEHKMLRACDQCHRQFLDPMRFTSAQKLDPLHFGFAELPLFCTPSMDQDAHHLYWETAALCSAACADNPSIRARLCGNPNLFPPPVRFCSEACHGAYKARYSKELPLNGDLDVDDVISAAKSHRSRISQALEVCLRRNAGALRMMKSSAEPDRARLRMQLTRALNVDVALLAAAAAMAEVAHIGSRSGGAACLPGGSAHWRKNPTTWAYALRIINTRTEVPMDRVVCARTTCDRWLQRVVKCAPIIFPGWV